MSASSGRAGFSAPARIGRAAGLVIGFVHAGLAGWAAVGRRATTLLAPFRAAGRAVSYFIVGLRAWLSVPRRLGEALRSAVRPRRVYGRFLGGMGNMLATFGVCCLIGGGAIRLNRHVQLVSAAERNPPPEYISVLGPIPVATEPIPQEPMAPDRIAIPAIGLDDDVNPVGWTHVFNGEEKTNVWETANYAAGFHTTSAPPGVPGNTVVSGHNNIMGSVFRDIHELKPGHRVYLYAGQQRRVYEVEASFIVEEEGASQEQRLENARWIDPTPDERLTLVSCYPPWSNTHRSIVIAKPVDGPATALDNPASQLD